MLEALQNLQIPFESIQVIPFDESPLTVQSTDPMLIPYGSTTMVKRGLNAGWKGTFFSWDTFNAHAWFNNRKDMLNEDGYILSVAEARDFMHRHQGEVWFVRPIDDLKAFSGQTIWSSDFVQWIDNMSHGGYTFGETKELVIAPQKKIHAEWRYFVVGGKVVSGSMYRANGQMRRERVTEQDVLEEAQSMANDWLPHETCVMDLALTDVGLKVIEFNGFNASGFYNHDIQAIVEAATRYSDALAGGSSGRFPKPACGGSTPLEGAK